MPDHRNFPIDPTAVRLTREQVRGVDRLAIEHLGIPGIVLMENAARAVADVAAEMIRDSSTAADVTGHGLVLILCGGGNNGGDGLAVARHLLTRGHRPVVGVLVDPTRYQGDARINADAVARIGLPVVRIGDRLPLEVRPTLVIDAIFGTGLDRPIRRPMAGIIDAVNTLGVPVLSVDLPSGLDCDTGRPLGACIRAARTVTFVAAKAGFADPESRRWTGLVSVADIGVPLEVLLPLLPPPSF